MNLVDIKKLAETGKIINALNAINFILHDRDDDNLEALRIRAYVYNLNRNYSEALADRLKIVSSTEPKLKDYFLAANAALYIKSYHLAVDLLDNLLEKGAEKNNNWFNSTAFFLLAYCYMQEGDYKKASINLDKAEFIETDVSIPIPLTVKIYNVDILRGEIRAKSTRK